MYTRASDLGDARQNGVDSFAGIGECLSGWSDSNAESDKDPVQADLEVDVVVNEFAAAAKLASTASLFLFPLRGVLGHEVGRGAAPKPSSESLER